VGNIGIHEEIACWIVWERATDGGRPWLRAIDTSEEKANLHVRALVDGARCEGKPAPDIVIEESKINHLYAADLVGALLKRSAAKRARRERGKG
jgi:hypothetical protein